MDFRDPSKSLKICVEKCPDHNLDTIEVIVTSSLKWWRHHQHIIICRKLKSLHWSLRVICAIMTSLLILIHRWRHQWQDLVLYYQYLEGQLMTSSLLYLLDNDVISSSLFARCLPDFLPDFLYFAISQLDYHDVITQIIADIYVTRSAIIALCFAAFRKLWRHHLMCLCHYIIAVLSVVMVMLIRFWASFVVIIINIVLAITSIGI